MRGTDPSLLHTIPSLPRDHSSPWREWLEPVSCMERDTTVSLLDSLNGLWLGLLAYVSFLHIKIRLFSTETLWETHIRACGSAVKLQKKKWKQHQLFIGKIPVSLESWVGLNHSYFFHIFTWVPTASWSVIKPVRWWRCLICPCTIYSVSTRTFTTCWNTKGVSSGEEGDLSFPVSAQHVQAGGIGWSCDRERLNCSLWAAWKTLENMKNFLKRPKVNLCRLWEEEDSQEDKAG